MSIEYLITDQRDIGRIEPLWLKLNAHHEELSRYFKPVYASFRFENRKIALLAKSGIHPLHIQLAFHQGTPVGYCVSSLSDDGEGEIDSIFIERSCRGQGIGDIFMRKALDWLHGLQSRRKIISVAGGNEGAFGFYAHYGFLPTALQLEQVPEHHTVPPGLDSSPDLHIIESGVNELELIQPLWEKLSRFEGDLSSKLKEYFYHRSFAKMKTDILNNASAGFLHLDLVQPFESPHIVGYCVSTLSGDKIGRIESIYLEPEYRSQGAGRHLFQRALDWMDEIEAQKKVLKVVYENEAAIRFYQRFGFYTRYTTLLQIVSH